MDFAPVLDGYWPRIIRRQPRGRGTLIGLPRPYLVPSDGAMFQEMYYWDSYFAALGLPGTAHEGLLADIAENMGALFRRFGLIPNASRYYFLSRSQPPFFPQMIWLAYESLLRRGDDEAPRVLRRLMRLAEVEHQRVWLGTAQPHHRMVHAGLSRYFDINYLDVLAACESGWDHSTRCDDRWLEHLPVDLNAILYDGELRFAQAAETLGEAGKAAAWRQRAAQRAEIVRRLLWDEDQGFFFDYDWVHGRLTPHASLAGFYPLWAGLATPEQAARAVRDWLPRFSQPGGLVTTLVEREGRQWAWPNGWAPLQWIVAEGLDRYGFTVEARTVRETWCRTCATVFAASGALWEKYNVVETARPTEGGLYGTVAGFGWTNGVFKDFARRLV